MIVWRPDRTVLRRRRLQRLGFAFLVAGSCSRTLTVRGPAGLARTARTTPSLMPACPTWTTGSNACAILAGLAADDRSFWSGHGDDSAHADARRKRCAVHRPQCLRCNATGMRRTPVVLLLRVTRRARQGDRREAVESSGRCRRRSSVWRCSAVRSRRSRRDLDGDVIRPARSTGTSNPSARSA